MNRTLITLLTLIVCASGIFQVFGQNTKQKKNGNIYRLDKSMPSVYLTFEAKKVENIEDGSEKTFVLLRFHNNTRWRIILDMRGSEKPGEVSLFYEILNKKDEILEDKICTVCSFNSLKSGKSLSFRIPLERFKDSTNMRISYNYEWEVEPYSTPTQEPVHYVYLETEFLAMQ